MREKERRDNCSHHGGKLYQILLLQLPIKVWLSKQICPDVPMDYRQLLLPSPLTDLKKKKRVII